MIRNGYVNLIDRVSFSIEIDICDDYDNHAPVEYGPQSTQIKCHHKKAIDLLLRSIYFTMYYTKGYVIFQSNDNLGKHPVIVKDEFHS